jgi:hypothetical protein
LQGRGRIDDGAEEAKDDCGLWECWDAWGVWKVWMYMERWNENPFRMLSYQVKVLVWKPRALRWSRHCI